MTITPELIAQIRVDLKPCDLRDRGAAKSRVISQVPALLDVLEEARENYQTLLDAHTEMLSPSDRCQRYRLQACHACDRADCGDNMTPSVVAMREQIAKRDEVIKRLFDVAKVLLALKRVPVGVCGQTVGQGAVALRGTVSEQFIGSTQAALDTAKEVLHA